MMDSRQRVSQRRTAGGSSRALLSSERVISVAADLADEIGFDRLTLSGVAAQLDVPTPNLYNHVKGFDALQGELGDRAEAELARRMTEAAVGRSGRDALFALASAYRLFAAEHPGLYTALSRRAHGPDAERYARTAAFRGIFASALSAYELDDDDVIDVVRSVRAVLHGFASLEVSGSFVLERDRDDTYLRLIDALHIAITRWKTPLPPS